MLVPSAFLFSIPLVLLSLLDPRSSQFNRSETDELLRKHLDGFREKTKEQIRMHRADETHHVTAIVGDSGEEYQIEFEEIPAKEGIRLLGSIDEGRLRAFFPLTQEIITLKSTICSCFQGIS